MRAPSGGPVEPGDAALMMHHVGHHVAAEDRPDDAHQYLCVAAYCSVASVALTENDRCINMMPLFHGHGVNDILLASMAAGAGVVCTPGL